MKPRALFFIAIAAGFSSVHPAHAATYTETGDAGDLPATAQNISGAAGTALTQINGALTLTNNVSDGDMFKIHISSPASFSASMVFARGVNQFDSQLMLFNASGQGIVVNDDAPTTGSPQASIPVGALTGQPVGDYYLLVDGSGRYGVSSSGALIFPNYNDGSTDPTGVYGPNNSSAVLTGYTGASDEAGAYAIALAGTQFTSVPESSGVAYFGAAAAGLALLRRLRRHTDEAAS